jgi:hypothetical protein
VYKQLFKKKDRQLMATLRFGLTDDAQNNMNKTITNFYQNGAVDSIDVIDQMRVFDGTLLKPLAAKSPTANRLQKNSYWCRITRITGTIHPRTATRSIKAITANTKVWTRFSATTSTWTLSRTAA